MFKHVLFFSIFILSFSSYAQLRTSTAHIEIIHSFGNFPLAAASGREGLANGIKKTARKRAIKLCQKINKKLFSYTLDIKSGSRDFGEYAAALDSQGTFSVFYIEPFQPCFDCQFEPYAVFKKIRCE